MSFRIGLRPTMAKEGQAAGLEGIAGALKTAAQKGPPPVHLWQPPDCGDIDIGAAADGTWFYQKTPIGRPALVRLFASVLRRDGDRYVLVTPVEKCGITVDEAPFLAVELVLDAADSPSSRAGGRALRLRPHRDDCGTGGPEHQ